MKNKALDYVKQKTGADDIHLEHWLAVLGHGDELAVRGRYLLIPLKDKLGDFGYDFNLAGDQQSEEFYQAFCETVGIADGSK